MNGVRYFMRNFTATAVREHLRSQVEETGGSPKLTPKELDLVRFICDGSFDWNAFLAEGGSAGENPVARSAHSA